MHRMTFRDAAETDIPTIVALLADDKLGATRETPGDLAPYRAAFAELAADPNQRLVVAEYDGRVAGVFQLTFIPGIAHQGAKRAVIESVRVSQAERGAGLGTQMIEWAVGEARRAGCGVVQLTSHNDRVDAHRFYERLGFEPSHVGFKIKL